MEIQKLQIKSINEVEFIVFMSILFSGDTLIPNFDLEKVGQGQWSNDILIHFCRLCGTVQ